MSRIAFLTRVLMRSIRAAELVERPLPAFGHAELLDEIEPVDRHVELRVLRVLQEHEVARRPGGRASPMYFPTP